MGDSAKICTHENFPLYGTRTRVCDMHKGCVEHGANGWPVGDTVSALSFSGHQTLPVITDSPYWITVVSSSSLISRSTMAFISSVTSDLRPLLGCLAIVPVTA